MGGLWGRQHISNIETPTDGDGLFSKEDLGHPKAKQPPLHLPPSTRRSGHNEMQAGGTGCPLGTICWLIKVKT